MSVPDSKKACVVAAVEMILAVADCIRELGSVPSGHLYAQLMAAVPLEVYQAIIRHLVDGKCVKQEGHLLTWIGPVPAGKMAPK